MFCNIEYFISYQIKVPKGHKKIKKSIIRYIFTNFCFISEARGYLGFYSDGGDIFVGQVTKKLQNA